MAAKVNCSICGKLTDPTLDNCPHCGSPMEAGRHVAPPTAPAGEQCPSCKAPVQDGDIVCVRCGVNLLTGHQVAQLAPNVPVAAPTNKTPYLIALLVVVVVGLVGTLAYVLLQDPIKSARQAARTGDALGAINILQKYTATVDDDAPAFAMLGRLYWQTQQFPDASTSFETASRLKPEDEDLAFMAVLAAGKLEGTAGNSRQLSALKRMVVNHPNNAQAQKMLALAQGAAGDIAGSEASLATWQGLSDTPDDVTTFKGIVDAMDGDFGAAHQSLDSVSPSNADAQMAKGYLASLEGYRAEAATTLSEGLNASGGDTTAATRLGLLYMAQGDFDKALPLLRPDAGISPSDSMRFFYALCMQTAGLDDEALTEFDRILSGGGTFAEDAALQMAILYGERDQLDRAEESIRKARKFGSSSRSYTIEGQIAALQGNLVGAQDLYRKAIQEDAEYPAAHLEHGLAYVRRGALEEGVRELERYLELSTADVPGSRINEIDLLVKQLQQTLNRGES